MLVYHQHVKGGRRDIVRCISVGGGGSHRYKYDVYVVDLGKDANFGTVLDGVSLSTTRTWCLLRNKHKRSFSIFMAKSPNLL